MSCLDSLLRRKSVLKEASFISELKLAYESSLISFSVLSNEDSLICHYHHLCKFYNYRMAMHRSRPYPNRQLP